MTFSADVPLKNPSVVEDSGARRRARLHRPAYPRRRGAAPASGDDLEAVAGRDDGFNASWGVSAAVPPPGRLLRRPDGPEFLVATKL